MDLVLFEENMPFVLRALEDGDFDYIDSASEVFETDFFRYINAKAILTDLTETYPTPRKKEDVPLKPGRGTARGAGSGWGSPRSSS